MSEQLATQKQLQQPTDGTMANADVQLDSEEMFQKMYPMISPGIKSQWRPLGNVLKLSYGELNLIEENASQKAIEACALVMLERWRLQNQAHNGDTPDKLIKALKDIGKLRYAAELQKAADNKKIDEYTDQKIARIIASYWDDVGIRLGVKNLKNIKTINSPTEHKFKEMLETWLEKQTGSEHDVLLEFHKALIAIERDADAEIFKDKALKPNESTNGDNNEPGDIN